MGNSEEQDPTSSPKQSPPRGEEKISDKSNDRQPAAQDSSTSFCDDVAESAGNFGYATADLGEEVLDTVAESAADMAEGISTAMSDAGTAMSTAANDAYVSGSRGFASCMLPDRFHVRRGFMKAIRVGRFGSCDVLRVEEIPVPLLNNPDQILVKVKYAGINPCDTFIREGRFPELPMLPYTPGLDGAGLVVKFGVNVKHVNEGQRVFMTALKHTDTTGTYAEYCVVNAEFVFALDERFSFQQGAGLGLPYMTAYRALIYKCHPEKGERVLIHGASGAIGSALIQFAKNIDLVVSATAGTEEGVIHVKNMGADFVYNHNESRYLEHAVHAVRDAFDIIVELMADVNLSNDIHVLARNGTISVVASRGHARINPVSLMVVEGSIKGTSVFKSSKDEYDEQMLAILNGIRDGWINPVIGKEFTIDEVKKAHRANVGRKMIKGKLVLQTTGGFTEGMI